MNSNTFLRLWIGLFVLIFFAYLFGPLILMGVTAFNSASFPTVSPWDCFTVEWFGKLARDDALMTGLRNSVFIGLGVVVLAVPLGLAAALVLTQIRPRLRSFYYTVVISPILIPGVVLGISTLIFWDRLGAMFNAGYSSFFYNGFFLTILGQTTFISAYTMLVFLSRLQRFDPAQEEAALDLGASHFQAFRKVLIPFLKPAIASAAVLAFLASFENYNTTVFTIVSGKTLTTVLASKVRYGIDPSISALAVTIVTLTLVGAIIHEMLRRREQARELGQPPQRQLTAMTNPALLLVTLVGIAGLGAAWLEFSGYNANTCEARVMEAKRQAAEKRAAELRQQMKHAPVPGGTSTGSQPGAAVQQPGASGDKAFGNVFNPANLQQQTGTRNGQPAKTPAKPDSQSDSSGGDKAFGNVFNPTNLKQQSGTGN